MKMEGMPSTLLIQPLSFDIHNWYYTGSSHKDSLKYIVMSIVDIMKGMNEQGQPTSTTTHTDELVLGD